MNQALSKTFERRVELLNHTKYLVKQRVKVNRVSVTFPLFARSVLLGRVAE